ncbi:MAG: EAL domain-containing protein [Proteobacteria bacterium]|nr:EAL domain-containing protein [Pseudomonadota bacterium]
MEFVTADAATTGATTAPAGRILIIDDEANIRATMTRCLKRSAYAVSVAADGPAGLEQLAAGDIDLVLLDINMPGMSGFDVLAEIRRSHAPSELPVLMVSASGQSCDILRAIQSDANDYVVKPVEARALLWRIETHLARCRAELALRESEQRLTLALRGSNEGLWDWDRDSGAIYFSPRWKALLGYGETEGPASFDAWLELVHPDDRVMFVGAIDAHVSGDTPQLDIEYRIRHRSGEYRWARTRGAYASIGRNAARIVGAQTDVTDRKLVDAATGLPNRVRFKDCLDEALRAKQPFAVALINIDRFRVINEGLGSEAGDVLLGCFAERFKGALAPAHMLARLGGDEFALLAPDVSSDAEMSLLIAECRRRFEAPVTVGEHALHISFRVGAVIADAEHRVPGDLLHRADMALRSAKLQIEDRVAFGERPARGVALARLKLENDLHCALAQDEFVAVFQPIVALATGRTVGFEALARWHKPGQGMIAPGCFVPVAEETALIGAIDDRILALACGEAARWPCPAFITVNVSGYRFGDPALITGIARRLAGSGLDPRRLKLEITESTIMTDASATARTVKAIAERGIGVAIDDFGTGYSSLAYLHRFDATTLKIDRSFVQAMAESDQGVEIVRTIIMLARTLKMSVVAEGIETRAQCDVLRALSCDYGQGYYFAKPLSADDARRRLSLEIDMVKEAV